MITLRNIDKHSIYNKNKNYAIEILISPNHCNVSDKIIIMLQYFWEITS